MDKHTVITAIAIIVIIIPFAHSGMNIHAAEQLKYGWTEPERFSFFEMSNNENVKLCNEVPYAANFKNFQITTFYDTKNLGTYSIENLNIDGNQLKSEKGKFSSNNFIESQHLFMGMDFQFDGGEMRIDPSKLFVLVSIDTPIIGVIPYTLTTQYTGFDFDQLMNQNLEC